MSLADIVQDRITVIDAEIVRVKAAGQSAIAQLQADRAVLTQTLAALAKVPEAEQLIPALRKLGVV